jgi:predicted secreted protein
MRKQWIVFLLIPLLVAGLAVGTSAATGTQQIEVTYRDIAIQVNGQKIQTDVEPFIYQDRTFVPIRFIAQSLGKMVTWDQEKAQVRVAQPMVLDESFNGGTIYLSKEWEIFSLMLEGNPTTGFNWEVDKGLDTSTLALAGEPVYMSQRAGFQLTGGNYLFSFITQGKIGEVPLKLVYHRSWEDAAPEKTFTATVRIDLTESEVTLTDADNGAAAYLLLGSQKLALVLTANPSTGYNWTGQGINDAVLKQDGDPVFTADKDIPGSPGKMVFKFTPQAPGESKITLIYQRAGQTSADDKTYEVSVGVY